MNNNKRSKGVLKHTIDLNTDIVELEIYDISIVSYPRVKLILDKQLDVNDNIKKRLDEIHKAIDIITKGINDEYIEVSSV